MIWVWLALLLICSGMISASETALFGMSRRTRHAFARSPSRSKRLAAHLMEHPQRVLMTVLLANNLANVAIFALSVVALGRGGESSAFSALALSVGVLLAVITLGEIVPKALAIANPSHFAPFAGFFLGAFGAVLNVPVWILRSALVDPLVRLLGPTSLQTGPVTGEELRLLVEHSARDGVIDSREHDLLQAAVAAGGVKVREVMTPRVDVRAVYIGSSRRQVVEQAVGASCRRFPVYGRDLDDIRGVLRVRDLFLDDRAPLRQLVRPPHFVPEQATLLQVVRHFKAEGVEYAVVVDEFGGTAGVCSLQDIAEWILGEIPEEEEESGPREVDVERIDRQTYRIPGNLSARLWARRFPVGREDQQFDTVAGLVLAKLGRMPREGDSVHLGNLSLTVERIRRRRIERLLLRLSDTPAAVSNA